MFGNRKSSCDQTLMFRIRFRLAFATAGNKSGFDASKLSKLQQIRGYLCYPILGMIENRRSVKVSMMHNHQRPVNNMSTTNGKVVTNCKVVTNGKTAKLRGQVLTSGKLHNNSFMYGIIGPTQPLSLGCL